MQKGKWAAMTILETARLRIREFTTDDTLLVMQYSQEPCKRAELPDEVFETWEDAVKQVDMCIGNYAKKKYPLVYGIEAKETGTLIGDILLCPIPEGIEVGYAVSEKYQGHGYAAEALAPFAGWAKQTLGLSTLYGEAKKSNIASWRTLEKAGFSFSHEKELDFFGETPMFKVYRC
ncbi:MAG: GNAT family N-acetyltransferase [Candidatus Limiplasma sp.]|nr:GNAT family N-acetyltransferase [Candidatus Limiplasma sp.]